MGNKGLEWMRAISLIACGISCLVLGIAGILGRSLPEGLVRALGIIELVALPCLIFSMFRLNRLKR